MAQDKATALRSLLGDEDDADYQNERMLDAAVLRMRAEGKAAIRIECFNKAEADKIEQYASRVHPGVKVFVTWLEFKPR